MSITPTGTPAWVRSNDHTAYGGHINKTNYQSIGTTNPRTDLSAENLCRIAADLAAVARTAPFAVLKYTNNDGAPATPTIDEYTAMAGNAPTGVRNGTGDVTFTWAASYNDPYSQAGTVRIIAAIASVNGTTAIFPNTSHNDTAVRNETNNTVPAAVGDKQVTLTIWTG